MNSANETIREHFPKDFDHTLFDKPAYQDKLVQVFNAAKILLIQAIDDDRRIKLETRRQMVARVARVKLQTQTQHRDSVGYVAAFWSDSYAVLAETSIAEMPTANLINLFAHELSHSFDDTSAYYSLMENGPYTFLNDEVANPSSKKARLISGPMEWSDLAPVMNDLKRWKITDSQMAESVSDDFARRASILYIQQLPKSEQKRAAIEGQMDVIVQGCTQKNRKYLDEESHLGPNLKTRVEGTYFGDPTMARLADCDQS